MEEDGHGVAEKGHVQGTGARGMQEVCRTDIDVGHARWTYNRDIWEGHVRYT